MTIQAIETSYKGYRFRSRLEARWAVFFDALGIKWEYEKEGYNLGDAGWYLPDFWLPDQEYWVEIKGQKPSSDEILKVYRLSESFINTPVSTILLAGSPMIGEYEVYAPSAGNMGVVKDCAWIDCFVCRTLSISFYTNIKKKPGFIYDCWYCCCDITQPPFKESLKSAGCRHFKYKDNGYIISDNSPSITPRLMNAYTAARSARFEYGETPQIVAYPADRPDRDLVWHDVDVIVRDGPMPTIHLNDGGVPLCSPLKDSLSDGGFNLDKWKPIRADVPVRNICKRCIDYSIARGKRKHARQASSL